LGNKLTTKKIKEINLLDPLPYTKIIDIEQEEVVSQVIEKEIISELTEEIIENITTEIELNITNESVEQIKPKDDNESEGQITLEL